MEETKLTGRGGPGRGQGRKPSAAEDVLHVVSVRFTQAQREKLARLGGLPWLRAKIDSTKPEKAPAAEPESREREPEAQRLVTPIRLTAGQRAKLGELGGGAWLRARIDKAREPKA